MESVVLELTASGSVSDYTDSDKSRLWQKVANAAGVDKSVVTIRVTAASVRITATVAVPDSMTADQVRTSLSSGLGTADAASTALGITVEEEPVITVIGSDSSSSGLGAPQIAGIAIGAAFALILFLAVCAFFTVRLRQEQNGSSRVHKPGPVVPQAHETNAKDHDVKVESV
jgi:hypothetical protein